jgi:hypothetical protein
MLASRIGLRLAIHTGTARCVLAGAGPALFRPRARDRDDRLGNYLPTLRSPWPLQRQPFAWQQVHRFVG